MSVSEIKKKLHSEIDKIDNEEYLQALLTILVDSKSEEEAHMLSEKQLEIIKERERRIESGESKLETLDEFKEKMNKKYVW